MEAANHNLTRRNSPFCDLRWGVSSLNLIVASTVVIRVVAIVTGKAGRSMQGLRVAVAAGGATVIHPAPAFVCDAWMTAIILGKPVFRRMTGSAIETKHPRMKDRVAMTTHACRPQPGKSTRGMALFTDKILMRTRQREVAPVVIEIRILPIGRAVAGGAPRTPHTSGTGCGRQIRRARHGRAHQFQWGSCRNRSHTAHNALDPAPHVPTREQCVYPHPV